MTATADLWERAAARLERSVVSARTARTAGELACVLDVRTVQTPALRLIDRALAATIDTPGGRLILTMPPQEGKSSRASVYFPLLCLRDHPDWRIAIVSYQLDLARRWGGAIRNLIKAHPEIGLHVSADTAAKHEWTLTGRHDDDCACLDCPRDDRDYTGGVICTGIEGAITGRPIDCVAGDTYIITDRGRITAADAFRDGITRILAYDHATDSAVWREVEAARRIRGRQVIEVITDSGRVLACTPDHRVYTRRGYLPARDLQVRDSLVAVLGVGGMPMRECPGDSEDGPPEGNPARTEPVLLTGMHECDVLGCESDSVLPMRELHPAQPEGRMLRCMPALSTAPPGEDVWAMRRDVPAHLVSYPVLRQGLRRSSPFPSHGRSRELTLQDWDELRTVVPVDAPADPGARRQLLRGMPGLSNGYLPAWRQDGDAIESGHPPYRRERGRQPAGEPDNTLRELPHHPSQVVTDTVALVRERSGETVDVYDFQVGGTRNFFANGLLVHNCLIIDDPVKGRAEADSEAYRTATWNWWTDSARTRLAPAAPVVLVLTRWHEHDLAGMLQDNDEATWTVLNIPAQADHRPEKGETDPLGRAPGEWMESARGPDREHTDWIPIQTKTPTTFAALYQGKPAPAEGILLKRGFWRSYDVARYTLRPGGKYLILGKPDEVLSSWDMSFKDTKASDWVVGQIWARWGLDAYLIWQIRERMSFTRTCAVFEQTAKEWPQVVLKLVEEKANGAAVMDQLAQTVTGMVPVNPTDGKYARAVAVSPYAESRHIYLPSDAVSPWVGLFIDECAVFPNSAYDDQVDAFSQAIERLLGHPTKASITAPPAQVDRGRGIAGALGSSLLAGGRY